MSLSHSTPMRLAAAVLAICLIAAQPLALGAHGWGGSADHGPGHELPAPAAALLATGPMGGGDHDHEPAECALCDFVQQGREKATIGPGPIVPDAADAATFLTADRLNRPLDDFSFHALGPRAPPVCA